MAEKNYKVDEEIKVVYQAPGAATGQVVTMEIYDEAGAKDPVDFPDVVMTEVGATGRYRGSFTPDDAGEWEIQIALASGDGQVVQQYSVGSYNVDAVGTIVSDLDTQLDTVEGKIDGLDSPAMVG